MRGVLGWDLRVWYRIGFRGVCLRPRHNIVDWKWEYMEGAFRALSPIIDVFLSTFDEVKLKTPVGQAEPSSGGIDPSCLQGIKAAAQEKMRFSALIESFCVFSSACGREARWFTGCQCHNRIWRLPISEAAQMKLFRQEMGFNAWECIFRGRRASELARGYWRTMVARMKCASSQRLHNRLTKLLPGDRAAVLQGFQAMRASRCEEVESKLKY